MIADKEPPSPRPRRAAVGDNLDWNADWEDVTLCLELPFWLMVPDCTVNVNARGHDFSVSVTEHYCQIHGMQLTDSLQTCSYQGPFPPPKRILETSIASGVATMLRKCKTVLRIASRCNADVCRASGEEDAKRRRSADYYLVSLCSAHVPIVNRLLRAYVLQTYDPGVHEVSPWDVPIWFLTRKGGEAVRVLLLQAAAWDLKPRVFPWNPTERAPQVGVPFEFVSAEELGKGLGLVATPGELELAQAMHLRERGDYSGAVRRSVTALEILLEARLEAELSAKYPAQEVARQLKLSRNNFPGRLQQYQVLSGRVMPGALGAELVKVRELRHSIVHRGRSLTFEERGLANRTVDFSRFIFQWLENDEPQRKRRERLLVKRQVGMHFAVFGTEITPQGVVVKGIT